MTNVPSLRSSSLLWFVTQGAGSSTMIDGKFCLLYLEGLSLGLGRFSSSASVVYLEEMQQKRDRNPMADSVSMLDAVEECGGKGTDLELGEWRGWAGRSRSIGLNILARDPILSN